MLTGLIIYYIFFYHHYILNKKLPTGLRVCRHHTRMFLSQLPAASKELLRSREMSAISAEAPLKVARRRPSRTAHSFTRLSSEPVTTNLGGGLFREWGGGNYTTGLPGLSSEPGS